MASHPNEEGSNTHRSTLVDSAEAAEIRSSSITEEMEQSYIDYAMSVIGGRAIPDVRDGLKPVHRRILYAMYEEGVGSSGTHRKSSSIVGATMGNYHPHGDKSIYDTLVRLAQDFSLRDPLVDGQGNFGSIDGDPPAAMRYTEARMAELAEEMVDDLGEDVVDFSTNYDGRLEEPDVLPTKFPNLLVNGSSGIAVGMATNMVPHNLGEVIDATIHRIQNPNSSVDDLLEHIKAPDFPTGAQILGTDGFEQAYRTGDGSVTVRAEYRVEKSSSGADKIIITEIPWQTKKSNLVESIADKANDDIDGIKDLRDESDRNGIRIVIETKKKSNTELIEKKLQSSVLQKDISINNVVLVDGKPKRVSLTEILDEFISHRREVVQRRSESRLEEAESEAHLLEGRIQALREIETVVPLIRDSEDRDSAKQSLIEELNLTEEQAGHIVRMQLGSLTSLEEESLRSDYEKTQEKIERLTKITEDADELDSVIIGELEDIKDTYATPRRTSIKDEYEEVSDEDVIPNEEVVVTVADSGHIKRVPADEFRVQGRRGKGVYSVDIQDDSSLLSTLSVKTHETVVFLSDDDQLYAMKAHEIPESSRRTRGRPIQTHFKLDPDENIVAVSSLGENAFEGDTEEKSLVFVTRNGAVKRTNLSEYDSSYLWSSGLRAITTPEEDTVEQIHLVDESDTLAIQSARGNVIRFDVEECREIGRSGKGVAGMKTEDGDYVVDSTPAPADESGSLLVVSSEGFGKSTSLSEYRVQSRGGKGYTNLKGLDRNGPVVGIEHLSEDEQVVRIQASDGNLISVSSADIPEVGRATKGSLIMETEEESTVCSLSVDT